MFKLIGNVMFGLIFLLYTACSSSKPAAEEEKEQKEVEPKGPSCEDACWMHFKDPRTSPIPVRIYFDTYSWPKYQECLQKAIESSQTPFEMLCRETAIGTCNLYCLQELNKNQDLFAGFEKKIQD